MLIYNYNKDGYFISSNEAKLDPLETSKKGENVYLLPSNATFDEPLESKEKKLIRYIENKWIYEDIIEEPIEEETLVDAKESKIYQAKLTAQQLIVEQYPDYKQRNILMSNDDLAIADMNAFIEPIRIRSNEIESDINDCTTIEELNNVNTDF